MLDCLIPEIYDAALHPERWTAIVRSLRERFAATGAVLFTPGPAPPERTLYVADNIDPEFVARYSEHWYQEDVWIQSAHAGGLLRAYNQAVGEALVDRRHLLATPFFNEFLKPLGAQGLASTVIFDEQDAAEAPTIYLSLYGAVGRPEFDPRVLEQIRVLIPHLRRALAIHWRLQGLQGESALRQEMLDTLPQAVFLLDAKGVIIASNQKGSELLRAPGILIVRAGRLAALGVRSTPSLPEALARSDGGMGTKIAFLDSPSGGQGAWCARLTPLRSNERFAHMWPAANRLLIVEAPDRPDPSSLVAFAALYRLTPAEREVLALLIQDQTPAEIAECLRINITTVRTHLQRLREKTGTRRQAELMRIALAATR